MVLNSLTQTKKDVLSYSSKNAEINSKNINLKFKKGKFKAKRTSENPGTITFTYNNLKPDQVGYIRFSKNLMEQIVVLNSYQMKQKPDYRLPFTVSINGKDVHLQQYTDQLIGVQADKDGKLVVKMTLDGKSNEVEFKYPRFVNIDQTALEDKVKSSK